MAVEVVGQQPQPDALPHHVAPIFVAQCAADAEGGQLLVAVLPHPVAVFAAQHVNHIACRKTLPDAVHTAQQLLHQLRAVKPFGRVQAVVAVAAGGRFFAEMAQQQLAAAGGGFAHVEHGVEFLQFDLFLEIGSLAFGNALFQQHQRVHAVTQPAHRGQAVAPRPAAFLIEMLDALRHVQMRHKAHVGLVDAHAEGHRGHNDDVVFVRETVLVVLACFQAHAGMVRHGIQAVFAQKGGGVFHRFAA